MLPLQWAQLTKTVHTARLGREFVFVFFGLHELSSCYVCFVLPWSVESFPFMFWRWRNKLKWAPFEFFAPPRRCEFGAGSIPLRAIVNKKQFETRGLFMSLVIHYWIGDVQDCQGVSASEMTCIVLSGALNCTHSLTHSLTSYLYIKCIIWTAISWLQILLCPHIPRVWNVAVPALVLVFSLVFSSQVYITEGK